jgi:ABC-type amino acid transport substrate-binding protein
MTLRVRTGVLVLVLVVAVTHLLGTAVDVARAAQVDDGVTDEVTVVAFEVEPFVVRSGEVPGGIMFDVWEQVAAELGLSYTVVWVDSLDELGGLLTDGGADVAVAPLSSTSEREDTFDFSTPVVASGPAFGVHQRAENPITLAGALFSRDTLRLLLWSGLGLLLLGHLMWFVDRRSADSDLADTYVRGVWDGVWWATVTVTTVGYGDTSPKTTASRLVAMLAMLGSLLLVGAFVSEVTTALQAGRAATVVADVRDLEGRPVGVVENSSAAAFLDERGVTTVDHPSQTEAFAAVASGDLDVVVADAYTLAAVGGDYGLRSTGQPLYDEFIAFGLRDGDEVRDAVNAALSDLHRQGVVRDVVDRWSD